MSFEYIAGQILFYTFIGLLAIVILALAIAGLVTLARAYRADNPKDRP